MTFEEFFVKKKIDLAQLKTAEPGLFLEFKSHFELMGEKSFDQVKKFWFNKLRKVYHLKEISKPAKVTIVKEKIASQAEPLSSPTLDQKPEDFPASKPTAPAITETTKTEASAQPVLKPKFTPRNIPSKPKGTVIAEVPEEEIKKEDASKPAASYKPRFNPKNIKAKEESGAPIPASAENTSKESFIENAANPAASEVEESNKTDEAEKKEVKPVFKPRFNMKNIKPKEESGIDLPSSSSETGAEENTTPPTENEAKDSSRETIAPEEIQPEKTETKPAYKPRFKMKNIQPKEESGIELPASSAEKSAEEKTTPPTENEVKNFGGETISQEETQQPEKTETKPAYKPRFNIKNIKPKPEE